MPQVDGPNDIDIILILPADWDVRVDLRPFEYNLMSSRSTRKEYGIEVYPVLPGSETERNFVELFHQVRIEWCRAFGWPAGTRKGFVRVVL